MSLHPHFAWAVGLFEGEGCIYLVRPRGRNKTQGWGRVRLGIHLTDLDVLQRFHEAVGVGTMHGPYDKGMGKHGPNKPQWHWQITGEAAADLLILMYPLLGERRRARAEEALRAHDAERPVLAARACVCGEDFTPRQVTQAYCSQRCKSRAAYGRKRELTGRTV